VLAKAISNLTVQHTRKNHFRPCAMRTSNLNRYKTLEGNLLEKGKLEGKKAYAKII
jgi:hypothetical protein